MIENDFMTELLPTIRDEAPITLWMEFLIDPYSEKVKYICEFVPEIREAKEIFEKAKSDPEVQKLIKLQEKATRDHPSDIVDTKKKSNE